jgi:CrcB protein
MDKFLWIAFGSILGAWSRYWMGLWAVEKWGSDFALGTLIINISGSFIMAWVLTLSATRGVFTPNIRLFLTVGFCAAFTTFSTFSWDTFRYISEGNFKFASLNIIVSVGAGLAGTWGGITLAKLL